MHQYSALPTSTSIPAAESISFSENDSDGTPVVDKSDHVVRQIHFSLGEDADKPRLVESPYTLKTY